LYGLSKDGVFAVAGDGKAQLLFGGMVARYAISDYFVLKVTSPDDFYLGSKRSVVWYSLSTKNYRVLYESKSKNINTFSVDKIGRIFIAEMDVAIIINP
jgi:hypothetical protein